MTKRKASKADLIKCKGFETHPCFLCKRLDLNHPTTIPSDVYEDPETGATACIHVIQ